MSQKRRRQTRHHIQPRSRIPDGQDKDHDNIVELDDEWHRCWHYLMENLTVDEAIEMIRQVMIPGERWTYTDLRKLRNKVRRTT